MHPENALSSALIGTDDVNDFGGTVSCLMMPLSLCEASAGNWQGKGQHVCLFCLKLSFLLFFFFFPDDLFIFAVKTKLSKVHSKNLIIVFS